MVNHNAIGSQVRVIAPFHKLPARCADYAGHTGVLRNIRIEVLPNCQVEFDGHLIGGFLPEQLKVVT